MQRVGWILSGLVFGIALAFATAWASLALWYRVPGPEWMRSLAACAMALVGVAAIGAVVLRRGLPAVMLFGLVFCGILVWWGWIKPPAVADWAPEVSRQVTGTVDGDTLTLTNLRNFEWRSDTDFTERWETRSYDLSKLRTLDIIMSYWAGPEMAHVIMSFGFEGGEQLAWSIEVRRRVDGAFSPLADLFKSNALIIVATDERDVVRVRSNIRGEDVQIYRLRSQPDRVRSLLLEYVEDSNRLAKTPEFYNSIATNCTTTVVKMMRAADDKVAFDWRLIVNGYLPGYLYDRGSVDTRIPLEELVARAHIDGRARAADMSPDFSRLIRVGVPSPATP